MTECSFLSFRKDYRVKSQVSDPFEKQIVHYSIYCSFYVVVVDVLMFLDCVQISSCGFCGV